MGIMDTTGRMPADRITEVRGMDDTCETLARTMERVAEAARRCAEAVIRE